MGKSALLEDLVATAGSDVRVLRAQGVESEAPLPFAALHRLLRPVLGILDRLPAPQARALRAAFGEADDVAVEPFLAALATLSVLTEAAEDATVLCVIDDAQWLDQATADAVLVAARRLGADRVAVVFAARDGEGRTFAPDGVPAVALDAADRRRGPRAARRGGRRRRARRRRGPADDPGRREPARPRRAPQHACPRSSSPAPTPLPAQLHLTAGIERVFLDRCRRLPPDGADPAAGRRRRRLRSRRHRPRAPPRASASTPTALDAAERSGLLVVDGDIVRVRHPLVRRRCTRPPPAGNAAKRTARSPTPSAPPATRTGTRGTAPQPSTAPTRTSSPA